MARLEVRPEAELDALETMLWYEGERDGLGGEFLQELRATFVRVERGPLQFPLVWQSFRPAIVHRFPFGVFFTLEGESATIMAVTHLHRDPKHWQERE